MIIHFVGIGGIGISGLAQLCKSRGDQISGSNSGENTMFAVLREAAITDLYDHHNEKNIPEKCDLIIYTEAVPVDNCEREAGRQRGIREKSYFEFLGEISHEFRTIAVAGTHGKTTTTGMLTSGFIETNFDATILVGSTLPELNDKNFRVGDNGFLVVEACEYRENFQFLKPEVVVLTNVEWDHADAFPTEKEYFEAFERFCAKAKVVIYHQGDENAEKVLEKFKGQKLAIPAQMESSWQVLLQVYGNANYDNATLALATAHQLNLDLEKFKTGLAKFKGAGRRQELLGQIKGVKVFDDYGHHPTEIKATLQAFRAQFPQAKIGLIFEPHQFSRTKLFFEEFCTSLALADEVGLFPIYEARDTEEDKKFTVNNFFEALPDAHFIQKKEDVLLVLNKLKKGDVLLFMGAGNISGFAREFLGK